MANLLSDHRHVGHGLLLHGSTWCKLLFKSQDGVLSFEEALLDVESIFLAQRT